MFNHGWPVLDLLAMPSKPSFYANTIRNLVSDGNIVVFANYDWDDPINFVDWTHPLQDLVDVRTNIWDGFVQAATYRSARMKLSDIGIWGHSLGGGVSPELAKQVWNRGWGRTSFWLALDAPGDAYYRCSPTITNPFIPPSPAAYDYAGNCTDITFPTAMAARLRVLVTSYRGDLPSIHLMSWRVYVDMTNLPAGHKWGVVVNNDCSHTPAGGACANEDCYSDTYPCFAMPPPWLTAFGATSAGPIDCPQEAPDCRVGHLTATIYKDYPISLEDLRDENHQNYYGVYRNLQALSDCARLGGASCTVDRSSMGTWSDGVPATPAEVLS